MVCGGVGGWVWVWVCAAIAVSISFAFFSTRARPAHGRRVTLGVSCFAFFLKLIIVFFLVLWNGSDVRVVG